MASGVDQFRSLFVLRRLIAFANRIHLASEDGTLFGIDKLDGPLLLTCYPETMGRSVPLNSDRPRRQPGTFASPSVRNCHWITVLPKRESDLDFLLGFREIERPAT